MTTVFDRPYSGTVRDIRTLSWIATTDHKRIGIMYMVAALCFFVAGGIEALLIRLQLAQPNSTFISPQTYNQLFTMHGRPSLLPSQIIYPPPDSSTAGQTALQQRLWQGDGVLGAIYAADGAFYALLHRLGVRADMMVGHSFGDFFPLMMASGSMLFAPPSATVGSSIRAGRSRC